MFGRKYFGAHYFGPSYFGSVSALATPDFAPRILTANAIFDKQFNTSAVFDKALALSAVFDKAFDIIVRVEQDT